MLPRERKELGAENELLEPGVEFLICFSLHLVISAIARGLTLST